MLTGCSVIDPYAVPNQAPVQSIPAIPEIKRQPAVIRPSYVPPQKTIVLPPTTIIRRYPSQPKTLEKLPLLTKQQQLEEQQKTAEKAKQVAIENATVDIDPYATVPDNSAPKASSPAVKTLLISARADIALGKSRSAISKLERGLRIEPQNANLWHMLAKAHYSNSAYLHAVSMAKKSNSNTNDEKLIAKNWKLIKLAGERSGNAAVIKEALDYIKLNP